MGGAGERAHSRERAQGRAGRRVRRLILRRFPVDDRRRFRSRDPVRGDGFAELDHLRARVLYLRLPRAVAHARHRVLLGARRGARGRSVAARRAVRRRRRRWREHDDRPRRDDGFRQDRRRSVTGRADQGIFLGRRRHLPRRGWRPPRAQAPRRCGARRGSDPRRHQRFGGQFRRALQRYDRPEPRGAGEGPRKRVRRRRHRSDHGRLRRGARHGDDPRGPDRGERARRGPRQRPLGPGAHAARLGQDQLRPPRVRSGRRRAAQGRALHAARRAAADHQLRRPQPVHRLRRRAPVGRVREGRVAALLGRRDRRRVRLRLRRHQRSRRPLGVQRARRWGLFYR